MALNVNRVFVQQVYKEISDAIELSRRNPDCWKDVISIEEARRLNCPRPVLQVAQHLLIHTHLQWHDIV